jgi:hypothetical protein
VSTNEELLGKRVAAPAKKTEITAVEIRRADHDTHYPQKLVLISPASGGHSVGTVRSRTKATELLVTLVWI